MGKIIPITRIKTIAQGLKKTGKKIVLAGGCFDILHIGHITFLEKARISGDTLILLLESDAAIKQLKGEKRPINNQTNRAQILAAIQYVDFVVTLPKPFKTEEYNQLVAEIKPDVIAVTAGDQNLTNKKSQAREAGGVVKIVLKNIPDHSTTKLLEYS